MAYIINQSILEKNMLDAPVLLRDDALGCFGLFNFCLRQIFTDFFFHRFESGFLLDNKRRTFSNSDSLFFQICYQDSS